MMAVSHTLCLFELLIVHILEINTVSAKGRMHMSGSSSLGVVWGKFADFCC